MDIPPDIQKKLKCCECDELLSCGPVYLIHETGGAICGRCSQQPEDEEPDSKTETAEEASKTRNSPYEATATLLAFPCAYASRGCPEKLPFVLGTPPHEASCEFRPIVCPIAPQGSCDWIGSFTELKKHCEEKHPANVFGNPCIFPRPDITKSNLQNYLVSAFSFLFLLQVKVCVTSGKLLYLVRMLGDIFDKFSFNFEITGNGSKLVKEGSVLRAGIMALQEQTAICTKINSLLDFVDGKYDQTEFRLTINTSLVFNCVSCLKDTVSDIKFCDECQRNLVKCKFNINGCSFVDVNQYKCFKHEKRFCKYKTKCFLCGVNFDGGSFIEHLASSTSCKNTIKGNLNSVIRIGKTTTIFKYIILSSNSFGTIICEYRLFLCTNFYYYLTINLYSPLAFYDLEKLKCSVEIIDPRIKHTEIITPQILKNLEDDWSFEVKMNNFPSVNDIGVDIKINFNKICCK